MTSMWNKVQAGAKKAAAQAQVAVQDGVSQAGVASQGLKQSFSLPAEAEKASAILKVFLANPSDPNSALNAIPKAVLLAAKGLAVFQVVKAGFLVSGKVGSGLVVARLPDGSWSAPSCIATGGLGWGLQVGADITDFVIVLNSVEAVQAFAKGGNVTVGGNLSVAAGPIGTGGSIQSALISPTPMFSYSKSKGLFAGISLEGTVLVTRNDANAAFYGSQLPAKDILSGTVPAPEIASKLYDIVEAAEGIDETNVPAESYIPTTEGAQPAAVPQAGYTS